MEWLNISTLFWQFLATKAKLKIEAFSFYTIKAIFIEVINIMPFFSKLTWSHWYIKEVKVYYRILKIKIKNQVEDNARQNWVFFQAKYWSNPKIIHPASRRRSSCLSRVSTTGQRKVCGRQLPRLIYDLLWYFDAPPSTLTSQSEGERGVLPLL